MAKPNIFTLLADADKRNGFPAGTMQSIMQQETGGNAKYLNDPAAYHYAPNAEGKRIAGHTGKVSTAFGPFGILESTGSKPGYGVAPLKDKSLEEQVRFASEYLAGRSKHAGSLEAGLAGYGEGPKYAAKVMGRIPGANTQVAAKASTSVLALPDEQMPQLSSMPMAQAPMPAPVVVAQAPVQPATINTNPPAVAEQIAMAPKPVPMDPWAALGRAMPDQAMRPVDIDFESAMRNQQLNEMQNEEAAIIPANNADRTQAILKKFGLGQYAQDLERYQASVSEFTRPA